MNLITGLFHCQACGAKGNPYKAAQIMGSSDRQAAMLAQRFNLFMTLEKSEQPKVRLPTERKIADWRHAMRDNTAVIKRLGKVKGWTPEAIVRLGLGWDGERIVFPIRAIVSRKLKLVGVVRYLPGGDPKTKAVPGSKRDLFPCPELIHPRHPIFLVEGEPDAVAVWSCGHRAVAVPGAGSWRSEWSMRLARRRVIVLADCDSQGRALAARVERDVPRVKIVDLEFGRSDGADIGDWVKEASREGGLAQVSRVLERLL